MSGMTDSDWALQVIGMFEPHLLKLQASRHDLLEVHTARVTHCPLLSVRARRNPLIQHLLFGTALSRGSPVVPAPL